MDTRLNASRLLAGLLTGLLALPAGAGSFYKLVADDGSITFTDVPPPPSDMRIVEARVIAQTGTGATAAAKPAGMPYYEFPEFDEALTRANAKVDFAEHELAVTRQQLGSPGDGLRLATARTARDDRARVDYYKRGVQIARQQLTDLLRQRQAQAPIQLASR